jgi:hypothetical protein
MKNTFRFVLIYVAISAMLGALILLQSFPARPTTWVGWCLLLVLVLPVSLIGEFVGESLFRNPMNQAVERHTRGKSFSWLRIAAGVVLTLIVCAGVVAANLLVTGRL